MMSFPGSVLCLFLVALSVTAQPVRKLQQNASLVSVCQGESLAIVSQGCVDAGACKLAAEEMGLQIGTDKFPFEGEWEDKGCYFFAADHPLYPNEAYFGTGGTCSQLRITPQAGAQRVSCDGTTLPPFDPALCPGEVCITLEGCREAALAMGLKLGNTEYPFAGDYEIKGCTYFPTTDPSYPGEAYWGSGASICGQLRADPTDGSIRLGCEALEVGATDLEDTESVSTQALEVTEVPENTEAPEATEVLEETEAPEETEALEVTEAPEETEISELSNQTVLTAPVSRPVQRPAVAPSMPSVATVGFNTTSPAMSPNFAAELNQDGEDDKNDKEDKEGRPGGSIAAFESTSAASTMQIGWVLSVFAVVSYSLS